VSSGRWVPHRASDRECRSPCFVSRCVIGVGCAKTRIPFWPPDQASRHAYLCRTELICVSKVRLSCSDNVRAKAGRKGRRAAAAGGTGHDLPRVPLQGRAGRGTAGRRAGPPGPGGTAGPHGAPHTGKPGCSGAAAGPAAAPPGARLAHRAAPARGWIPGAMPVVDLRSYDRKRWLTPGTAPAMRRRRPQNWPFRAARPRRHRHRQAEQSRPPGRMTAQAPRHFL
jgi:hypothetical protein